MVWQEKRPLKKRGLSSVIEQSPGWQMRYFAIEEDDLKIIVRPLREPDPLLLFVMEAWLKIGNFLDKKEKEVMAVLESGAALWIASLNGHTDVVKLLIENHARVNSRGSNGTTALWAAAQNGHTDIVELLDKK